MGSIWLRNLPDVLENLRNVTLFKGWETRSRSSGGYTRLMGIVVHHTASSTSTYSDTNWMWNNSPVKPVGAIYLARNGEIVVGAAGATNCAGKGGPYVTSKGTIPLDTGNSNTISIEAGNAGTGEPWPKVQQDTYVALVAALCEGYGLDPLRDVMAHFEWAPTRKIDPAGSSKYAVGGNKWNMDRFRADVAVGAPAPLPPKPIPPSTNKEDAMLIGRDATTKKLWIGNIIEKVTYSDDDADYAISLAVKGGSPLRDAGKGTEVHNVEDVTEVSDRVIRMMGSEP